MANHPSISARHHELTSAAPELLQLFSGGRYRRCRFYEHKYRSPALQRAYNDISVL
jgi:hypothetical protein